MDILDEFVQEAELTYENIVKYLDDYSIYSHYIGTELELGIKYSSPLREGDENPSFALYFSRTNKEVLMFKDHGDGSNGNVVMFVSSFFDITYNQALLKINSDFELGFSNINIGEKLPAINKKFAPVLKKDKVKLRITSRAYESHRYLAYWKQLDITKDTRDIYEARDTALLHFITPGKHLRVTPKSVCISYEINGFYKFYQPLGDRIYKFRNDFPYGYVEGGLQLRWDKPFVIITKSTKECMFFRQHFDWDSCAGTSENSMISPTFMAKLFDKYPVVYIWLDNDRPGKVAQQRYVDLYPDIIPVDYVYKDFKDPTDAYMYSEDVDKYHVLTDISMLIEP